MGSRFRAVVVTTAFLLGSAPVRAQSAPPDPAAAAAPGPTQAGSGPSAAITLDTISVTSTKTDERAIDSLSGTSVVTRKDIDAIQPTRASEILQNVPGVTTQESQNDPSQSVNIRGLQDFGRVNVLVDGARQDFQISGHNANGTYYLDPEFIGQADVTRGPVSNIYGSGAIGGVVSYETKGVEDVLGSDRAYGVLQKFGAGSNGAEFLNSTAAAVRVTNADLFGQFVYRGIDPYFDGNGDKVADSGSSLLGTSFKLNVRPADGHTISATALNQAYDFTNNGTSGQGSRFHDKVTTGNYTLGYTFMRPELRAIDFSAKVYYSNTDDKQTAVAPDQTYSALGVQPGDPLSDKMHTTGFDIHNTSRFDTGPIEHALTYGGDSAWDEVTTMDQAGGFISALTPSGSRRLSGAFVQDEARYGGFLRVLGGLRYDDYQLDGGPYHSGGSRLSPKITVGVTPLRGIEVYGTYAEGYRAPSITETLIQGTHPFPAFNILPNPTLRPEVAHNVEGGVNLKYDDVLMAGDKVRAKATVFSNTVDNYIDMEAVGSPYLVPFIPGAPASLCGTQPSVCFPITSFQYLNIARARLTGVELEGGYDWGRGFVTVVGSHIDSKNVNTGTALLTSIPDRISPTLGYRFLDDRLTIGTRLTFVGPSVRVFDTTGALSNVPTKGYALAGLFATYQYNEDVRGDLVVKNLFNKQYIQYLNSDPDSGLSVRASLSIRFASK